MTTTAAPLILAEQSGRVLILTLNRPEDRNTVVGGTFDRLGELIDAAAADRSVGAVLLKGAGSHFCAGGDVGSLKSNAGGVMSEAQRITRAFTAAHIIKRLVELPKPTVAMLRGAVAGGGLALAAACDFRLTDTTLKLSFAYSRLGLGGDVGTTPLLVRLLGPVRFSEIAFLSPVLDATQAQDIGLARLVPGDLATEALLLAEKLAEIAPGAAASLKANIAAALTGDLASAMEVEARNFALGQADPDHAEAARAFLEKRKPVFPSIRRALSD